MIINSFKLSKLLHLSFLINTNGFIFSEPQNNIWREYLVKMKYSDYLLSKCYLSPKSNNLDWASPGAIVTSPHLLNNICDSIIENYKKRLITSIRKRYNHEIMLENISCDYGNSPIHKFMMFTWLKFENAYHAEFPHIEEKHGSYAQAEVQNEVYRKLMYGKYN